MGRCLYLFLILTLLLSCQRRGKLEQEDLFILPIGYMADELNYVLQPTSSQLPSVSDISMLDGRIYISSSNGGKVMVFNSYGDLLSLIYDPQLNPDPVQYTTQGGEGPINLESWDFQRIDRIATTSRFLLVAEQSPKESHLERDGIPYNRRILLFDHDGKFIDILGSTGRGGGPFPFIHDIQTTASDEIMVYTKFRNQRRLYWFSKEGDLLYELSLNALPLLEEEGWRHGSLENVKPSQTGPKVYMQIDYFSQSDSPNVSFISRIYTYDLERDAFVSYFTIPNFTIEVMEQSIDGVYEYLGSTLGEEHIFLGAEYNNSYQLLSINKGGRVIGNRRLFIQDDGIIHRQFYLSQKGLLLGIFYEDQGARVTWWRSDRMFN